MGSLSKATRIVLCWYMRPTCCQGLLEAFGGLPFWKAKPRKENFGNTTPSACWGHGPRIGKKLAPKPLALDTVLRALTWKK